MNTRIDATTSVGATPRDLLQQAIRERAILRGEDRRLMGPRGRTNNWLIDMRRLFMEPPLLNAFAELFFELMAGEDAFQVGGLEVAAVPLVTAILMKSLQRGTPVNGFIVRKERKAYGAGSLIEGRLTDAPIVIVDDIVNSGGSLEKIRVVLEEQRRTIAHVFVLVDYHSPTGRAWRHGHGITVHAPFTPADFGLVLRRPGEIPPQAQFRNVWSFAAPDPNFFYRVPKSFPVTDGKRVCFGSDSGTFWCLDAADGSVIWRFEVQARGHKNIWSAPALHAGKVFFGSYDGNVYCLDSASGAEIWRFIDADWVGSSPTPAPDLNLLFVGLDLAVEGKGGSIVALNLTSGEKVWEHPTERCMHGSAAYWPERRLIACSSNDDELFLLDASTGVLLWQFDASGGTVLKGSIRHTPAFDVKRGHLVTGCANGCIYVVDVRTGKEVWTVRTDNSVYTIPLVVNDTAYIGSTDKYFYLLDLEQRRVRKKIYTGAKIFGPPRLLNGRVYFGACNGKIYELDPQTGEISGTHQLLDSVTNALCYSSASQNFYALTHVNQLVAFRRVS